MIPNTLSIAGIDPSGGAGLLADLKAFSALGTYGMGVVCALTAQNTQGVTGVAGVAPDFIRQQLETLFSDVRVDAAKIGLLGTPDIVVTVSTFMIRHRVPFLVVDPVMVAKSGDPLLGPDGIAALKRDIVPLADLLTPNLHEAALLLGTAKPANLEDMRTAAKALLNLGPKAVLLKGGFLNGNESIDLLVDADGIEEFRAPRVPTKNLHGTGCNLAAALTALRVQRPDLRTTVRDAKRWLTEALQASSQLSVGQGHGPVHAFHEWWPKKGPRAGGGLDEAGESSA